jgi:CubicO group peptidase (beta-lactamase class C family)
VIRGGQVVGEWYKDADRTTDFNIYSSSKAYLSTAYGLALKDFGAPTQTALTLDAKICNREWLPESLPLPDPRKAEITVRNLLNMAGGLGEENPPKEKPFEWSLGHVDGSPMSRLKDDPGKVFHYSNAGLAHLVLVFPRATGTELFPFMKKHVFDPVGIRQARWTQIGGDGGIGPFSQGYSGLMTTPREHARFCYLALHRGMWAGKRIVPDSYYEFAWTGIAIKPDYGAQWWVYPRHKNAPHDLVQTAGARNNHGFEIPSLDLVFVRLGDSENYPVNFEDELIKRVLTAVEP